MNTSHRPVPARLARYLLPAAAALAALGCAQMAVQPAASEATVAAHVAAATTAAGTDLKALIRLCQPAPLTRPSSNDAGAQIRALIAMPAPAPGRAFDNLYYVGGAWASAWALKTSEGIILLDALNNTAEAQALIEGGMRKLGLDPAQIRIIIVTHGHGDHYGGAAYLAQKYGARVVMSEIDWRMTETKLEFDSPAWDPPPKRGARDVAVKDGDEVKLGDTTVSLHLAPGHTWGTLSPVFDVTNNGQRHRAMLWGGTSFNFGNDVPRMQAYVDATVRLDQLAQQRGVDVMLSNHPSFDGTITKLQPAAAAGQSLPADNRFVIGPAAVRRSLAVMNGCAQAQRDRYVLAGRAK